MLGYKKHVLKEKKMPILGLAVLGSSWVFRHVFRVLGKNIILYP